MGVFSLSNAIKALVLAGLLAFVFVNVRSCQKPATGFETYAVGSLAKLTALESPPAQPQQTFTDADGNTTNLAEFRGKPLLLNVWATWCAPCVVEMPMLNEVSKTRDDIEVLTVAFDDPAKAKDWLQREGLSLPAWTDPSYSLNAKLANPEMGQIGLPITVFYNPGGREIARVPGEVDWTSPEATVFLDYVASR